MLVLYDLCLLILGPWAKKFLQPLGLDLPLRPVRVESLYWETDPVPSNVNNGVCIIGFEEDDGCYIVPEYEYPGLIKVTLLITSTCIHQM